MTGPLSGICWCLDYGLSCSFSEKSGLLVLYFEASIKVTGSKYYIYLPLSSDDCEATKLVNVGACSSVGLFAHSGSPSSSNSAHWKNEHPLRPGAKPA